MKSQATQAELDFVSIIIYHPFTIDGCFMKIKRKVLITQAVLNKKITRVIR
jgi:hypothetical protein